MDHSEHAHGDHDHDHGEHDHHDDREHGHHDHGDLEASAELIRAALEEPRAEIVRTRIRFRVLYDMMVSRDRELAREFGRRYREAMTRDFQPLWDQLVTHDAGVFAAEHAEWLAGSSATSASCWATSSSRSWSTSGIAGARSRRRSRWDSAG